jgi:hypothetical protein
MILDIFTIGGVVWAIFDLSDASNPFTSVIDVVFTLAALAMIIGATFLLKKRQRRISRRLLVDFLLGLLFAIPLRNHVDSFIELFGCLGGMAILLGSLFLEAPESAQ